MTISAYCVEAIRARLVDKGYLPGGPSLSPADAARALDRLRHKIGPVGVPVRDLIEEGRRR